jgi:hypothetical protein
MHRDLKPANIKKLVWTLAAAAIAAIALAAGAWMWESPAGSPAVTLTIAPPSASGIQRVGGPWTAPEISPDGAAVAYRDAAMNVMVRRLDEIAPVLVPGTADLLNGVFWSTDSLIHVRLGWGNRPVR